MALPHDLLIRKAEAFAGNIHATQKRKYTGRPYIEHCVAVAEIVAHVDGDAEMIAAALMHDCVEDAEINGYSFESVRDAIYVNFPKRVLDLVMEVTDVSRKTDGNRAKRKEIDAKHLAKASRDGQTIKLADLIHNSADILRNDRHFAKVYIQEKKRLLEVLIRGDFELFQVAVHTVRDAEEQMRVLHGDGSYPAYLRSPADAFLEEVAAGHDNLPDPPVGLPAAEAQVLSADKALVIDRYLLFVGDVAAAAGGAHDMAGLYPTIHAAIIAAQRDFHSYAERWWHIYDFHAGKIILGSHRQSSNAAPLDPKLLGTERYDA